MTENFRELEWVKELEAFQAKNRVRLEMASKRVGKPVYDDMPLDVGVPHSRILAFAKAVRAQPEIWGPCVLEGLRRSHEVTDPNSELRREGWAKEWSDPDRYIHNIGLYNAFLDWFIMKHGDWRKYQHSLYYVANDILRKWASEEWDEGDDNIALTYIERWNRVGHTKSENKK